MNFVIAGSTGSGRNLVRYITPELIKRLAKEEQLEHVKTLTFSLSGEKKIRVCLQRLSRDFCHTK